METPPGKSDNAAGDTNKERSEKPGAHAWRNWGDHPVVTAITVIAGLIAIVSFFRGDGTKREVSCDSIVGRWDWISTGGVVAIADNRFMRWYRTASDPAPTINGTWECNDDNPTHIVFRWTETGLIDTFNVSEDGDRMSGANQQTGFRLTGMRLK